MVVVVLGPLVLVARVDGVVRGPLRVGAPPPLRLAASVTTAAGAPSRRDEGRGERGSGGAGEPLLQ